MATKSKKKSSKEKSKKEETVKKKKTRYAVFEEEFKGKPTLGIFEVDKDGEKVRDFPVIAFGKQKAKLLVKFADDIQEFAESEEE